MIKVKNFVYGEDSVDDYIDLPAYACLKHYGYDAYPDIMHKTFDNDGTDGLILTDTLYKQRTITLPLSLQPYLSLTMKQTIRLFEKEFLSYIRKNGAIVFLEEPDIMYLVSIESFTIDTFYETGTTATLTLVCHYPFGLCNVISQSDSNFSRTLTVTNEGTYKAFGRVLFYTDGESVERPKIYNAKNMGMLGYNGTFSAVEAEGIEFNCFSKTLTYQNRDASAYFMPRGNFFPFEVGENKLIISADANVAKLSCIIDFYATYIV